MNSKLCLLCGSSSLKKLFKKNGFDIVRCSECGLTFTVIPEDYDLKSIYNKEYFQGGLPDGYQDYVASHNVLKVEFRKLAKQIKRLFKNAKTKPRLLEVGSAFGFFLEEASTYFDSFGIEVSKVANDYAARNGLQVFEGEVSREILEKIGKVDIVVMLDVIEHLPNPVNAIDLLRQYLTDGGYIVIVTGNIDSMLAKLLGKNWRLMTPPQHAFFFSPKSITKLLVDRDFTINQLSSPWKFVPLGLAFYQLGARTGLRIRALERLNKIGLPVNLFDVVRVIARKTQ